MTRRPRLLILCFTPLVSDPRVNKQIDALAADFDLYSCGMGPAPRGVIKHYRLPDGARAWVNDRLAIFFRRYSHAYWRLPAVVATRETVPVGEFDIILANDIETVPVALALKPSVGVHADLHEYFPELKTNDWKWRLFVAPYMAWLCRTFLPKARSRTAGSAGFARRYESDLGIPFGVVTNAAPYAEREPTPVHDPIRIIYTTAGARARKIELVLEAMKGAPSHIALDLIVMPNEPAYVDELKRMGSQIPGVRFRDPVPYDALVDTVAEYDVALSFIPPTNFSKANALPNKFFEAVQARVGVIIGPGPEMSPLLERYGFGESTKDYAAESLATTLHNLTPEKVAAWKAAAHRAAPELSSEETVKVWHQALSAMAAEVVDDPVSSADRG